MRFGLTLLAAPLLAATLLAAPAEAQAPHSHAGMTMAPEGGDTSMMESMSKMSQAMANAPMTGDPDHDFVSMMIPHHQGAIDMAKYELAHGRDPGLRKLAQAIIAAQDKEIAEMRRWLAKHAPK